MKTTLMVFLFTICSIASATKYYVSSSNGDDSKDGKSETTAWKTISKVNASSFNPGDIIAFNKGDLWREMLTVPSSGNAGAYIIFTGYGTGAKPKILGSKQLITWTNTTGNIWESATSVSDPYSGTTGDIYFNSSDTTFGNPKTYTSNYSNLTSQYDWTWNSNKVYVYSATDPDAVYNSIEAAQRTFSIQLNDKDYIEINGLDMFYCQWGGIRQSIDNADPIGLTIRNCESAWHGTMNGYGYGVYVCYNNTLIEDCKFHDVGRRGASIVNYGNYNISNIVIQRCTFFNGWHTTGLDLETGSSGCNGDLDSVIFRNNLIYDDENKAAPYAISIWVQGPHGGAGEIHKAYFYNNIIKYQSLRGIAFEYVTGAHVYNNVFYGDNNSANGIIQCFPGYSSTGIKVKNNIFYTTLTNANTSLFATYGMSNSEVDADYNLYYASTLNTAIVYSGAGYHMNDIATIRSKFGWEMHSPTPADPLFVSSTDYHLKAGSPAIGAGIAIPGITTDFEGNPYGGSPNIGCYASYSTNKPPVISITIPSKSSSFTAPATIIINANAYDPDGTITKVEFFNGTVKIGETTTAPYSMTWKNVAAGTYSITAIATDNQYAATTSSAVIAVVSIITSEEPVNFGSDKMSLILYPNPNHGRFSIDLKNPRQAGRNIVTIFDMAGKNIYNGILPNQETTKQFDFSNIPSGIYILKVTGNEISAITKFNKN